MSPRILLALAVLLPLRLSAYTVSPSLVTLRTAGDGSSAFVELANRSMQPVAVELTVHEHHRDLDGQGVTGTLEVGDDFIIYPAQLVLLPGDETSVQVRWIGEPTLAAERAYTLMARQVPIPRGTTEEAEPTDGVRLDITVLTNYAVRIYVTPPGARPKVVVESITERAAAMDSGTGEPGQLEIILLNQGTARRSLADTPLTLVPLGQGGLPRGQTVFILPAGSIPTLKAPILAGERRRLLIPRPAGLPAGPVRVILTD